VPDCVIVGVSLHSIEGAGPFVGGGSDDSCCTVCTCDPEELGEGTGVCRTEAVPEADGVPDVLGSGGIVARWDGDGDPACDEVPVGAPL